MDGLANRCIHRSAKAPRGSYMSPRGALAIIYDTLVGRPGFEPGPPGSEPGDLPVNLSTKKLEEGGGIEPLTFESYPGVRSRLPDRSSGTLHHMASDSQDDCRCELCDDEVKVFMSFYLYADRPSVNYEVKA